MIPVDFTVQNYQVEIAKNIDEIEAGESTVLNAGSTKPLGNDQA